jgi:5'-nucleotidase
VIGLTTPKTATTTMPALVRGLRFEPLLATAEREARALRAVGVEVVILLAHGDAECNGPEPSGCQGEVFELLDRIEPGSIDVVVAGHSHRWIGRRYRGMLVVEACSRGLLVGRLELVVDRRRRRLDAAASRVLPPLRVCRDVFERSGSCEEPEGELGPILDNPWLAREAATVASARAIVERHRPPASDPVLRVVARSPRPLRHQMDGASEAGALFARSLLASVPGADAAIFNAGSVRADLPAGAIRYADLYQSFPFDNKVATATIRGAELRRLLELLLSHSYGVPLVAGFQLRLRCGARPGPRYAVAGLSDARGRPIEADRDYRVVLSDFLLTGGDGLGPLVDTIPAARKQLYPRLVRDAIANQLANVLLDPGPGSAAVRIEDAPCRHWQRGPGVRCE